MIRHWRLAWTIARRDYVAAVFSRLFLLFLALPVVLASVGGLFGALDASGGRAVGPPRAVVAVAGDDVAALIGARARIAARLGDDAVPILAARDRLTAGDAALLSGGLDHPRLTLVADAPDGLIGELTLLVETARAIPKPATIAITHSPARTEARPSDRVALARGVQYAILLLTVMLSGRLLSSFIEERSNKVIEVLAAAVPVDAIFLGKLIAMLLFSLTCAAGWGAVLLGGTLALAPALLAGLAAPALGWPLFVLLSIAYFAAAYLLFGAVLLGFGAQANSPADVQTLALPTTIAELLLFALASVDVARPEGTIARIAAAVPWSSPMAMAARAAEVPVLWPHLLALGWQAAWIALTIRLAAACFRRGVLKSGPVRRRG